MKKTIKISLIVLVSLVGAAVLSVGGYLGYIVLSYYRIGDAPLEIESRADSDRVKTGTTYSISTYNIGFSAYSQDFTFFMDTGYDSEGKATCGHFSKAKSKKERSSTFRVRSKPCRNSTRISSYCRKSTSIRRGLSTSIRISASAIRFRVTITFSR